MVVPMEQWASQPFQDLWVVMLSDHNEKYSDGMEISYKAFALTFELRFPFPLMPSGIKYRYLSIRWSIRNITTAALGMTMVALKTHVILLFSASTVPNFKALAWKTASGMTKMPKSVIGSICAYLMSCDAGFWKQPRSYPNKCVSPIWN